jgi:hypothetical protein
MLHQLSENIVEFFSPGSVLAVSAAETDPTDGTRDLVQSVDNG